MKLIKYTPPKSILDPELKSRYRLFYNCCFITILTMGGVIFNNFLFDFNQVQPSSTALAIVFIVLLILFKQRKLTVTQVSNLYILAGVIQVIISIFLSNSFESPVLFWCCLIPLYAFWLLNRQYAIYWYIIAMLIPVVFLILKFNNIAYPNSYDFYAGSHNVWALFVCLFLITNIFLIGNDFEKKKTKSIAEVNAVNIELKAILKKLEETKRDLEIAEKHKDLFIAQMSHEMRTPMNAVIGITELLKSSYNPEHGELLGILDQSSKQLLYLIDDILDITKIQSGKFHYNKIVYSPSNLIQSVVKQLKIKADEKNVSINLILEDPIPELQLGDPYRITQVLNNIIGNAIKFTSEGNVNIFTYHDTQDNTIVYTISDTGIGMSQQELSRVFQVFSQANPDIHLKYGGTGIGLSLSKQLIELFNGTIKIESQINSGTKVTISLPIELPEYENYTIKSAISDTKATIENLSGIHLLLAEDNEVNRLVLVKLLTNEIPFVNIDTAINGNEVLRMIKVKNYDVILMDIQMPEKNGIETIEIIRSSSNSQINEIRIIALTAFAGTQEAEICKRAGANDYLTKPVNKEELLNKLFIVMNHGFSA